MTRNERIRFLAIPLVGALVIYFGGYFAVEHLRQRKGPWEVEFTTANDRPAIRVTQPHLGIADLVLVLADEAVPAGFTNTVMRFTEPRDTPYPVPHGRVIFEDLTFLPGTVTFDFHGHGIELLPRTLILNGREHAWQSGQTLTLQPEEKKFPLTPAEYQERVKTRKKEQ